MPLFSHRPSAPLLGRKATPLLHSYFRSGWAFLIPYLAAYLLYAWLDWPVNAGGAGGQATIESGSSALHPFSLSVLPPPLLHVYWGLHAIHLALGVAALFAWQRRSQELGDRSRGQKPTESSNAPLNDGDAPIPSPSGRPPVSSLQSPVPGFPLLASSLQPPAPPLLPAATRYSLLATLPRFAPWICLALLFWIPGVYLEWPSDPWEHLRRINEWQTHNSVTAHYNWKKYSYFLPYSLTSHTAGHVQLNYLNLYYTAICLLLSWQYYRLARIVGLGERASFIFVLMNALTFGNNIFSFYRYYGLSSSIIAQIAAVAIMRMLVEYAPRLATFTPRDRCARGHAHRCSTRGQNIFATLGATATLAALCMFNHPQAIGIGIFSIGAILGWRIVESGLRSIMIFVTGILAASVLVIAWYPLHPDTQSGLQSSGWVYAWGGFTLLTPGSPAALRALEVIGLLGLINLVAGVLLLARNHVVGWFTLAPPLLMMTPAVGIPLASLHWENDLIVSFNRYLFGIPAPLALCIAVNALCRRIPSAECSTLPSHRVILRGFVFAPLLLSLTAFFGMAPTPISGARLFHALSRQNGSLTERWVDKVKIDGSPIPCTTIGTRIHGPEVVLFALSALGQNKAALLQQTWWKQRVIGRRATEIAQSWTRISPDRANLVYWLEPNEITSYSQAGFCSRHWNSYTMALQTTGTREFLTAARIDGDAPP